MSGCGSLGQQGTGPPPQADDSLTGDCGAASGVGPGQHHIYIYQGDDWRRTIRWESPPGTAAADLTGAAIAIQVREGAAVNHPTVLFEASVGDGVTITDGPGAEFTVLLESAKTVLLHGSDPFLYDLSVTPAGGDTNTILRGQVYFDLQVTT